MAKSTLNQRAYADLTSAVMISPLGTTIPTTPLPTAWPAGWVELGFLTDKGVIETATRQKTKKWNWQGGSAARSLYNQAEHSFSIECNEENARVLRLARPGSTVTTVAGTSEIQTVTLTGTGTAGTWTLTLPGVGTATGLAFSITMIALQTALSTAFGLTMPLPTGTVGTSYVVTFPATAGNVPTMVASNNITGVTGITVATTTAGVNPVNTTNVVAFTGTDYWQFGIDLVDGGIHKRYVAPIGDATLTGTLTYAGSDLLTYAFDVDCYPDTNNTLIIDINDNPALSATSF